MAPKKNRAFRRFKVLAAHRVRREARLKRIKARKLVQVQKREAANAT